MESWKMNQAFVLEIDSANLQGALQFNLAEGKSGFRELSAEEISVVGGGWDAADFGMAAGIAGIGVGGAGVVAAIALATGPVGLGVGFGIAMGGLFLSSASFAASQV
jgi:hypothetical protein